MTFPFDFFDKVRWLVCQFVHMMKDAEKDISVSNILRSHDKF